ncbi:MAG: hypothetical protein VKP62_01435 [Candidatus Sericytochromatia bacterium]|nr:hypothetical protein [Candidatus Sericytochromatia bacterium]
MTCPSQPSLPPAPLKRPPASLPVWLAEHRLWGELSRVAVRLGVRLLVVGGGVRDWLLGRTPGDWDLVVSHSPQRFVAALRDALPVTATVLLDEAMQVWRLQLADGTVLDVAAMQEGNLIADLSRRDLTLNAIAWELPDGIWHDPLSGIADLQAGLLRVPARQNLEDDPLRVLRVYRFAATLGYTISEPFAAWAGELAPLLRHPAGERMGAEWAKILASGRAACTLQLMQAHGTLGEALGCPQADWQAGILTIAAGEKSWNQRPGDAWARTRTWLEGPVREDRPRLQAVMLAALLAPLAEAPRAGVMTRLRLSRKEVQLVRCLCEEAEGFARALRERFGKRAQHRLFKRCGENFPGLAWLQAATATPPDRELIGACLADYWQRVDHPLPRHVNGHDLLGLPGLGPGPAIADWLTAVEEETAVGALHSREEALAWVAARLGDAV